MADQVCFIDKDGQVYTDWPTGPALAPLRAALGSTSWSPMADTIHANVRGLFGTSIRKVAGYLTGSSDIRWTSADWGFFHGWGVVQIDQSGGTAALGDVKDCEPGAATIPQTVAWAKAQRAAGKRPVVYLAEFISRYSLVECRAAMRAAGVPDVRYWVANWGLTQSQAVLRLGGDIVAWQWCSPSSNPNGILPGTSRTLRQTNADLSVTLSSWCAPPAPRRHDASGTFNFTGSFDSDTGAWRVHGTPGSVTFATDDAWASAELQVNVKTGEWRSKPLPWNAPPLGK